MRPSHSCFRLTWLLLAGGVLAASPAMAQPGVSIADRMAAVLPEVVNLAVTKATVTPSVAGNMASQPSVKEQKTEASGFIIDPSGLIVTNRHAVTDATDVIVILNDGTRLRATVLATAEQADIALLKVDADLALPAVTFGDSDQLRPGDRVFAIGNPLGQGSSVTSGIVSALDRNTQESEASSFFQIDAAINHGNSGGPVVDTDGRVVGVSTALDSPSTGSVGIGYAIPSNFARFIADGLRREGRVSTGWIGAHVQSVTADIATAVGREAPGGSIVQSVDAGSPAARAGLDAGDVVLRLGGVAVEEPRVLSRMIAEARAGSTVELTVWRNGSMQEVPVVAAAAPPAAAGAKVTMPEPAPLTRVARDDLGLIVGPVTDRIRRKLGLAETQTGVAITTVVERSVAADHGIEPDSLILNVDRVPVSAPSEVRQHIDTARAERRRFLLVLIKDEEGLRWVSLPLLS